MRALLLLAAIVLVGCGTPRAWYKAGATERDFNMDTARCRMGAAGIQDRAPLPRGGAAATMEQAGRDLQDAATRAGYFRDCMISQGWEYR